MTKPVWQGIHSVLVTPFDEAGAIDIARYEALAQTNLDNGADGLIVCGSTGEFYALSIAERRKLITATVSVAAGKVPVLVGVSDLQFDTVKEMNGIAEAEGADGVLALPPIYAKPDAREAEHYYRQFAKTTALPIMLYNSPARIGVNITPDMVERLAELPNVAAIKDSSADIQQVTELARRVKDRLAVFVGYETMIRSTLPIGVTGVVAMAHQLSGKLVRNYYDACAQGNQAEADRLEPALFAIYACFKTGSFYAGIKAVMNELGFAVGDPREPLLPFSQSQQDAVRSRLEAANVRSVIASLK
ncbi:4-hydroxy-tetrahydrodipicolinate synthase [Aureimonas fodinaquatilis]|uniref:4-hydroxy-tetrahydrodipicolinate synthase n=1 Tax=Aureimonas fodinaquatilis TaxID=2565783 RepID=A0A5B0DVZ7_9HYPH|nr:4-hydroxy-tetrahydrodipicolinate synthase [Aureimonas fodinaquatilis]KAA0969359.1 4-hydroxy-tetrahydrodipicolinate synthase [Aureimonas fodinaquatilis]